MELHHIKFKNGEDLLGYVNEIDTHHVEISSPIIVIVDPHLGLFAKSWLLLSDSNSAVISRSHLMLMNKASATASEYYTEFMHRMHEREDTKQLVEDLDMNQELEDMFSAMIESRSISRKH